MAEMIANYSGPGAGAGVSTARDSAVSAPPAPASNGSGYLNEVSPLTARSASGEHR
jgi:hypothetical protein